MGDKPQLGEVEAEISHLMAFINNMVPLFDPSISSKVKGHIEAIEI